jgi:glycolate oxidase iron-sulfur subunit
VGDFVERDTSNNLTASAARDEADKCARCGKCRSVCPVFAELKDEAFVARGRIWLFEALERGEIRATPELRKIMSACLMCQRCAETCPSGVKFMRVIKAARERLSREMGLPLGAPFVFRHIITRRWLFDFAMQSISLLQRIVPGERKGNLRHLPLFFEGGKWLPPLAKNTALQLHSRGTRVPGARARVALFVGCLTNYAYPQIVDATIALLQKAKIEASVPSSQLCCGVPALAMGDIGAARELARRNRESLQSAQCDYIVTVCASCGRMLKHEYSDLTGGPDFSVPVLDVSEFIKNHTDLNLKPLSDKVTYHDPCHLRWGQGIASEPRQLLSKACQFSEIPDNMYCCGQAGTFHIFYPEIAGLIGRRKAESIALSDADYVATGCPGCILQLNDLMAQAGISKKAVHTVEILNRA